MQHRILIAEDEGLIAGAYRDKLDLSGYEVSVARNGQETLDQLRSWNPHVLLLDILLPIKDGFDVLHTMHKDKALRDIPVIVITQLDQEREKKKALKFGVKEYVVKADFDINELVKLIRRYTSL